MITEPLALYAQNGFFPASNAASPDERNRHPVISFSGSANQSARFNFCLPGSYTAGGITLKIGWTANDTSGDVDWDAAFERIGVAGQDVDSDGFAAVNSTDNETVPATSGHVKETTITFTDGADMDSVAAGEYCTLEITRDAVSDTSANPVQLHYVKVSET